MYQYERLANRITELEREIDQLHKEIQELKKQQPKQSKITTLKATTTNNPKTWRT
ncbi:MAG: PhoU domain-containing protein [Alphaproteobacteria bacterium]|nr:PhoU domain-containing protein [Alphaproteobacteria bacterium]MBQ3946823.1 PhoU domain-containing protein [Alphaproteobacteria bacterium]